MSKRPGKAKAISLIGAAPAAGGIVNIVYPAVEQDTVAMVQRLVIDMITATGPFHQVQYGLA